jgi:hypothetical protein
MGNRRFEDSCVVGARAAENAICFSCGHHTGRNCSSLVFGPSVNDSVFLAHPISADNLFRRKAWHSYKLERHSFYCIGILQRTFERGWYPSTLNIFVTLAVQDLMDWEDLPIPPDLYQKIFMSAPGPFTRSYCCHP